MMILRKALARATLLGAFLFGATGILPVSSAHAAEAGYTATKYPIILVHGLLGFDSALGGLLDYWYKIVPDLRSGGAKVFVAEVSGLNSTEARGEQLLSQVRYVMAATGATKVHLIGHSHGSPTIRYVAGVMPEAVASVTSVGGLNTRGAAVAESMGTTKGTPLGNALKAGAEALAWLIDFLSSKKIIDPATGAKAVPEDVYAAMYALNTAGMQEFNRKYPAGLPKTDCSELHGPAVVNGVRYYSWTGDAIFTTLVDPMDWVFAVTGLATRMADPNDRSANDGLVTLCASLLGTQLGIYRQNHLDEINLFYGLVSPDDVSPVVIYREHANRLMKLGL